MSLLTRCPRCRTLYRVTPAQLQTRDGKVRCGRCMNVFDGFQALQLEQENAASEPVRFEAEAPAAERPMPAERPGEILAATPPQAEYAPPAPDVVAEQLPLRVTAAPPAEHALPPMSDASQDAVRVTLSSPPARLPHEPAPPARWRKQWPFPNLSSPAGWIAGCAIALIVLALQLVYAARGELAARSPALKSVFSSVCARLGCSLSFPHHPELVKIEASDVRMVDASRRELVQLTATLRSYAGYYLAYPALDLVLTNANEHALARRVFVPQEYLGPNRDPNAGFAPHAEITIALDLDTGNENAAGFRLDLLAAP